MKRPTMHELYIRLSGPTYDRLIAALARALRVEADVAQRRLEVILRRLVRRLAANPALVTALLSEKAPPRSAARVRARRPTARRGPA